MIYNVTNDFIAIGVTGGTIQNNSYVYPIEVSDSPTANSGILLHPLNKCTFSNQRLYVRCPTAGGQAQVNVVPFIVDSGAITVSGGSSSVVTNPESFNDDDLNDIFRP